MIIARVGAVLVTGAILFAAATAPVRAASPYTVAFLTNVSPNLDFLDRSSRFALTNSKNARLKGFAQSEAREQTLAANALDEWIEARKESTIAVATADGEQLQTGRSVAVDGQLVEGRVADTRLPLGQEDLDSIEGMNGSEFDAQYKEKQLNALSQVQTDYEHYIAKGDDPDLIKMSKRELPKIKKRLILLGRM